MLVNVHFLLVMLVSCKTALGSLGEDLFAYDTAAAAANEIAENQVIEDGCPSWMYREGNSASCICGSNISGTVICDEEKPNHTLLHHGYCMTTHFDAKTRRNVTVLGRCPYFTFRGNNTKSDKLSTLFYVNIPGDRNELNAMGCGLLNRTGRLCSRCADGTYPSVLSYERKCVHCSKLTAYSVVLIFLASFVPLTLFYIIVLVFRLSATRASLTGFIFVAQIISAPQAMLTVSLYLSAIAHQGIKTVVEVMFTIYGIWNLDFFKIFFPDICIPHITTLQALSLEFTVTVYPLVLTAVTYLLIELHSRNCRVIHFVWKPFHILCIRFRKKWSIKTSIIDVFATFLLLSFMKLLISSTYFLMPTRIINIQGETVDPGTYYLYYDADTQISGPMVYACLSAIALTLLVLLPIFLLLFYQTNWFQICIGRCCFRYVSFQLTLKTFMDSFQGCYRDKTDGGLDCRFVSGLYLLLRLCVCIIYVANGVVFQLVVLLLSFSLFISLLRPYKKQYWFYNIIDPIVVFVLALAFFSASLLEYAGVAYQRYAKGYQVATASFAVIPLLYILCHGMFWFLRMIHLLKVCKDRRDTATMNELIDDNSNQYRYNEASSRCVYGSINT